jgi:hypothetical protein
MPQWSNRGIHANSYNEKKNLQNILFFKFITYRFSEIDIKQYLNLDKVFFVALWHWMMTTVVAECGTQMDD